MAMCLIVSHVCKQAVGASFYDVPVELVKSANPMRLFELAESAISFGLNGPLMVDQVWPAKEALEKVAGKAATEAAKRGAKEAAKRGAKRAAKKAAQEAAKKAFKRGGKEAARRVAKNAAERGAKRAAKKGLKRRLWPGAKKAYNGFKKKVRRGPVKARLGKASQEVREAYEKIDQSKNPISREDFLRELEADRKRYLTACIQVTTMVAQAKMLWTSMAALKTQDEVMTSMKKRLRDFAQAHLNFDPMKTSKDLTNSSMWVDALAHVRTLTDDKLQLAKEKLREIGDDVWQCMERLAEVQGFAVLHAGVAGVNAAWSAGTVWSMLSSPWWSPVQVTLSSLALVGSIINFGVSIHQFRSASIKMSRLTAIHDVLFMLALEMKDEEAHPPLPKGAALTVYIANVTVSSVKQSFTGVFRMFLEEKNKEPEDGEAEEEEYQVEEEVEGAEQGEDEDEEHEDEEFEEADERTDL